MSLPADESAALLPGEDSVLVERLAEILAAVDVPAMRALVGERVRVTTSFGRPGVSAAFMEGRLVEVEDDGGFTVDAVGERSGLWYGWPCLAVERLP